MRRRPRSPAALVLALVALPCVASAWCRSRSASGQPDPDRCPAEGAFLGWRERCVGYSLDPRALPEGLTLDEVRAAAERAAAAWASVSCDPSTGAPPSIALSALPDGDAPIGYFPGARNVDTVAFRDHWGDDAVHRAGATAITVVTFDPSTGQILDADTEFNVRSPSNPDGYLFGLAGDPAAADFQTVITHEFGHAQGLAHSAEPDAVMWFSAGRSFAQRAPTSDDAAAICAAAPAAAPVACDPLAAGAPRAIVAAPGCSVAASAPVVPSHALAMLVGLAVWRRSRRRRAVATALLSVATPAPCHRARRCCTPRATGSTRPTGG